MKWKIRLFLNLRLRIFLTFMKYSPGVGQGFLQKETVNTQPNLLIITK